MNKLHQLLFKPIDIAPLVVFRIGFGLLLFLEGVGAIFTGWVRRVMVEPEFTFSFIGFEWLQPLPGNGMYYYYALMGIVGLFIMFGLFFRPAMFVYFLMWTAVYLMQKSSYNNHYYLMVLLTGVCVFIPANKYFSLDVKRGAVEKAYYVPKWTSLIFIIQLLIVYTYASIAKMYPDWLEARPIEIWFGIKKDLPIIGPLLVQKPFQYFVAYMGIVFDMLVIPALIWRKTRVYAFIAAIFFHIFNSLVFQIGIFPYMMLVMSVFFFEPETIRRLFFRKKREIPAPGFALFEPPAWQRKLLLYGFGVYFAVQILLPLRHWFFTGNVHWTEAGHRLSWHMMLRTKYGFIHYNVYLPSRDETIRIDPSNFMSPKQASKLGARPDMVWQFAQRLKKKYQEEGEEAPEVYAFCKASLNGRPLQPLVDSTVDLANVSWDHFKTQDWIIPLDEGVGE